MPSAGFEPAIPANGRPQIHALDRAATGIGSPYEYPKKIQDFGEFTVDGMVKQQSLHTIVVLPSSWPIIQKDLWTP